MLKIIAGKHRHKKILTPSKTNIIPSKNIVRESLFSIINFRIINSTFLDLFSGSGAIGLEALSRQAKHVTFVDQDLEATKTIKQNLFNFNEEEKSTLLHMDYQVALKSFLLENKTFDFIFLDPPYDSEFSTYTKNKFTKDDQLRLSKYLIDHCSAKWMLIIKKTELIKKSFLEYYDGHYCDKTCRYDGMSELVDGLHKAGIKLAVVTNKVEFMAKKIVTKLYGKNVDIIYGQRDGVPTKPDPTLALMAMKSLDVIPEECVFLGDSGVDIKTAVNSGAIPVGALWGFRDKDELVANGAKHLIDEPFKLLEIINK